MKHKFWRVVPGLDEILALERRQVLPGQGHLVYWVVNLSSPVDVDKDGGLAVLASSSFAYFS